MLLYRWMVREDVILTSSNNCSVCLTVPLLAVLLTPILRFPHAVVRSKQLATENPCEEYRVGGIVRACLSTYAARMECSLNVPTYRAGAGLTMPAPASRPLQRCGRRPINAPI